MAAKATSKPKTRKARKAVGSDTSVGAGQHYCSAPTPPAREFDRTVDPWRAALVRTHADKWVNRTEIHYYFFRDGEWGGRKAQQDVVRAAFAKWLALGIGLRFHEVSDPDEAELRIGFKSGDGSWSYLGTYALRIGQNLPTMNFGWDLRGSDGEDTALHEIGHALGLPHEHQNPNAGIVWDETAVYAALAAAPNFWPRDTTYHNIIRKLDPDSVQGSAWDPNSIMHYPFGKGLILSPEPYHRDGLTPAGGLSARDIEWIRTFYPPAEPEERTLTPFQSEALSIEPGEQSDFLIRPPATRSYVIQTFGTTDTVIVLFERRDGQWRYVAGDDDSGESWNARIETRLVMGREYMLRIRLYWSNASGDTAVMLW